MRTYFRLLIVLFLSLQTGVVCAAHFIRGPSGRCYVNDWETDEFWYCGSQSTGCAGVSDGWFDTAHWLNAGDKFDKFGTYYWCCSDGIFQIGNSSSSYQKTTQQVTETFKDSSGTVLGTCTWTKKINWCGGTMNASDKCTKPNNCAAGYVLMNDKCVKSCADGQAFSQESLSGNTDPVCVACEQTIKQGIVQNTCIKCALDEFFSEDEMKCVKKSSLLHVSVMGHDACWLCANPTDLTECLREVTNGRPVPNTSCVLKSQASSQQNGGNAGSGQATYTPNYVAAKFPLDLHEFQMNKTIATEKKKINTGI